MQAELELESVENDQVDRAPVFLSFSSAERYRVPQYNGALK